MNKLFGGVVVKDGYTMLALVNDGDLFHAIIKRERMQDFVFCYCYDVTDGTWGNGVYCQTYAQAAERLAQHLA